MRCVENRDGLCALPPGPMPAEGALSVSTRCGMIVTLPYGFLNGEPDCPACRSERLSPAQYRVLGTIIDLGSVPSPLVGHAVYAHTSDKKRLCFESTIRALMRAGFVKLEQGADRKWAYVPSELALDFRYQFGKDQYQTKG